MHEGETGGAGGMQGEGGCMREKQEELDRCKVGGDAVMNPIGGINVFQ